MFSMLLGLIVSANAATLALDPQNRLHVGLSYVQGAPGAAPFGVTAGFDSRLTRLIAIDFGAFTSPIALADGLGEDAELPTSAYLRHGIYVTPGIRIPHPQPRAWAWEVFLRAGAGVAWTADVASNSQAGDRYFMETDMAGIAGADALARFGRFGVRAAGKAWMYDQTQTSPLETFFLARGQWTVEALMQW